MNLKIWAPAELVLNEEVAKVKAEAENGWFCSPAAACRFRHFARSRNPGL